MTKASGFMAIARLDAPKRPIAERLLDSREYILPRQPAESVAQASRCMNCGIPFCHQGCPLGNVIPDFQEHVSLGRWREAFLVLNSTNNFPEFTGRLCPAPCEAACVLDIDRDAVTIEQIEKEIIERAFAEGWVKASPPHTRTGRRIAVVGSGPAGLAAAAQLNQIGHHVTVYERDKKPGGLLRYGIPDFKIDKSIIDRRLQLLVDEGIDFETGVDVGGLPRWDALAKEFDAVVLAMGARKARRLDVPGSELQGVVAAMDFLSEENRSVESGQPSPLSAQGKRVLILGGGDTGSDCLGTALRQGAKEVIQAELLPKPSDVRDESNPWPQWPMIFRVSSSQEEGGERIFARRTVRVTGQQGRVSGVDWVSVEMTNGKLIDLPGTEAHIEIDLIIEAMGFTGVECDSLVSQLGVELDARGNIQVDSRFATNVPRVYAAGDASRGASLIVWAISDGRELARHADAMLRGKPSSLPTKGRSCSFGGR